MTKNISDVLELITRETQDLVGDFYSSTPDAHLTEPLDALHTRLLNLQQFRSQLADTLANLHLLYGEVQHEAAREKTKLQLAEAKALPRLGLGDFDSAKVQNGKMTAATLDEYLAARKAEVMSTDTKAVLDFVREHLKELDRQSHELNLRLRLMTSDG